MIVQIIPSSGWRVKYGQGSDISIEPIVAWGLHDNGSVVPILSQDSVVSGDESDKPYEIVQPEQAL